MPLAALALTLVAAAAPHADLERPQALLPFFEALAALSHGERDQVRVVQLGDSHTAAGHQSGAARKALQHRFDAGLIWEALGVNGARAAALLERDEAQFAAELAHRAPTLVVLAYGTNESGEGGSLSAYEQQLTAVVERVQRAAPDAACLLLGPPDRAVATADGWVSSPKLAAIVAAQRRVAEAKGCAFFSQFDAMGGEGSIAQWARERPPRAVRDRVHLSREGYLQLGTALGAELLKAYDAWKARRASLAAPSL